MVSVDCLAVVIQTGIIRPRIR